MLKADTNRRHKGNGFGQIFNLSAFEMNWMSVCRFPAFCFFSELFQLFSFSVFSVIFVTMVNNTRRNN